MHANNRVFAYYDQIPTNIYAHEMRSTYGQNDVRVLYVRYREKMT